MAGKLVLMYSAMMARTHAEIAARSFLFDLLNKDRDRGLTRKLANIVIAAGSPENRNGNMVAIYNIVEPLDADVLVCVGAEYYDVFADGSHFAWDTLHYGVGHGAKLVPPFGQSPARDEMMRALLSILNPYVTQDLDKQVHPSCVAWVLRNEPCT